MWNRREHKDKDKWDIEISPEDTDKVKIRLSTTLKNGNPYSKERIVEFGQKSFLDKIPLRLQRKRQPKD